MQYLHFTEENSSEYELKGTLLNHSKISQNNRAVHFNVSQRLFAWLSDECFKQGISRQAFVLTCVYIDLFFMKKNDVALNEYQLLALGALILSTKVVEVGGKIPSVDLRQFKASQLLGMEQKIVIALNYYLNPPIYIDLLNNLAKIWDLKCQNGQIDSKVRYFQENDDSYIRLKILYEKMDCLNLFKRILNFNIHDVVVTLFYLQTKTFEQEINSSSQTSNNSTVIQCENPEEKTTFEMMFKNFLVQSDISIKPNSDVQKIIKLLTKEKFPVVPLTSQETRKRKIFKELDPSNPNYQQTFSQKISFQTHNPYGHQFYKKNQAAISKL